MTPDSLTSVTVIVNALRGERTVGAGRSHRDRVAGGRLVVQAAVDRHDAGRGVDGKQTARVVVQDVGNRVGGGVRIAGQARHADRGTDRGVFSHRIGRGVGVGDGAHVELVDVVDRDGEHLVGERTVGRGGAHRDVVAAPSASRSIAPATVTTPVLASMANRPPALSVSEYVIVLVVASASLAAAVILTTVPLAAFSFTALAMASLSVTAPTSNSSTSLIVMLNTWSVNEPSLEVARTVMLRLRAIRFPINGPGHRHDARVGVDGEPAAVVVRQAVRDRVGRGVRVTGRGRDIDQRAVGRVLIHRIGHCVAVGDAPTSNSSTSVTAIEKLCVEKDPSLLVAGRTVTEMAGGRLVVQGGVDGDHARRGVDGEAAAGVCRPGCS